MTPASISVERLRELLAKATALPWEADAGTVRPAPESPDRVTIAYCSGEGSPQGEADAELIAAAINALPALLQQLAELKEDVQDLRDDLERAQREHVDAQSRLRAAERAREEATGLLRKIDGLIPGEILGTQLCEELDAFLAASGGK